MIDDRTRLIAEWAHRIQGLDPAQVDTTDAAQAFIRALDAARDAAPRIPFGREPGDMLVALERLARDEADD